MPQVQEKCSKSVEVCSNDVIAELGILGWELHASWGASFKAFEQNSKEEASEREIDGSRTAGMWY